ncbi:hypothetical protein IJC60_06500 [bacterium]|nr:hypothetical protein [bacterium]
MSSISNPQQVRNTNTCPHGLPAGACPICNGGAGAKTKRNSGEWSYAKCAAVGAEMRAAKARIEARKELLEEQFSTALKIQKAIMNFIDKAQSILQAVHAKLPPELQTVFNKLANGIINPILNLISNIPKTLEQLNAFINDIKTKILAVAEKLNAILGEIKNFIEKNITDRFKKLTKKIIRFFILEEKEENYQNDEEIEIFKSRELRKLHMAILKLRRKGKKEDAKYSCN